MKKFICIALVVMCVVFGQTRKDFSLQNYFYGEYYSFTEQEVDNKSLNLGFCYMNKNIKAKNVIGEKMVCKNLELGQALKELKARVARVESVESLVVIYAYSPLINTGIKSEGQYVNLQIVEKENCCIIGWPVILSDF